MHTPNSHGPEKIDASHGYERSDVRVTGIVVFLTGLSILVAVSGVLCWGIGKVINTAMNKEDGPTSKWAKVADERDLGNLPNNPDLQNKVAQLTQQFPAPRLQSDGDDGGQDLVDLHDREDLLLDHYSTIDGQPGKVRIPIERAMELIAQHGLPVAPAVETQKPMVGDKVPVVTAPLTDGFASTALDQQEAAQRAAALAKPGEGQ
jgi:hypothetical protein